MFGSRMTAAGVVFVLAVAFQFGGLSLLGPLVSFITPTQADGSKVQLISTNMMDPVATIIMSFPAAGAAIGLGALIWLRFARRGPYPRVMAVLLGVVVASGLVAAVWYRYYIAASFAMSRSWAGMSGAVAMFNSSVVFTAAGLVPLIAASAALLVGAVMSAVTGRAARRADGA